MLFLYDLPNWLLGVVIVGGTLAIGYGAYFAFHRLCRATFSDDNCGVAMTVLGVVATVNSLLLAFSAVSVWESFSAADAAVVSEANSVSALARDLAVFDSAESRQARTMLREYAAMVVNVEWRDMQQGNANTDVWNHFDRMFLEVGRIEPDTPRRVALLPEILARINELLKERRSRLYTSQAEVPGTLWAVVLLGTLPTATMTFVLPLTRFNIWMVGVLMFSIGLVFYFIVAMVRPFAGKESISPQPFDIAIVNMQRWDSQIATPAQAK